MSRLRIPDASRTGVSGIVTAVLRMAGGVLFVAGLLSLVEPANGPTGAESGGESIGVPHLQWVGWAEMAAGAVVALAPPAIGMGVLTGTGAVLLGWRGWFLEAGAPCPCLAGLRQRLGFTAQSWDPWMRALAAWFLMAGLACMFVLWMGRERCRKPVAREVVPGLGMVLFLFWSLFWWTGAYREVLVGVDDCFELPKMLFLARHPDLARAAYNDQPWLHTLINARLMRWLGEEVLWPRLFQMFSVSAFWMAVGWLGQRQLGVAGLLGAAVLMLSNQETVPLWFSVMLEPAALAWACVSAACLYRPGGMPRHWQVVLSGVVMAAAAHMKLTAAVAAPGLVALVASQYGWMAGIRMLLPWMAGFLPAFGLFAFISPNFHWGWLLGVHWEARHTLTVEVLDVEMWGLFLRSGWLPTGVAGLAGLWIVLRRRDPAIGWWAVGMLCGALAFLGIARPWWPMYQLQFQIPMAVLGGLAVQQAWWNLRDVAVVAVRGGPAGVGRPVDTRWLASGFVKLLALPTLAALWIGPGAAEIGLGLPRMREMAWLVNPGRLELLRLFAPKVRWVYGSPETGGERFLAGVCAPPELLVVSGKRLASGTLDARRYRELIQSSRPEVLILSRRDLADPALLAWVRDTYECVHRTETHDMWVVRSLLPQGAVLQDLRPSLLGPSHGM